MPGPQGTDRRAIPQRSTRWAARLADLMHAAGLTPNRVSVGSVLFAAVGAAALVAAGHAATGDGARAGWLVLAAACIPLRLLLNMLDGMLAVEKGLHSPTGDLFNEVPDRVADVLLLAGAGYAAAGAWLVPGWGAGLDVGVLLGWTAAAAAVLTAYVRSLGAANGVGNFFEGVLPKPHRMWVLAAACLLSLLEPLLPVPRGTVLALALAVIAAGSVLTVARRLRLIAAALRELADAAPARPAGERTAGLPTDGGERA